MAKIHEINVRSHNKEMCNLKKSEKRWEKREKRADYNPWKLWSNLCDTRQLRGQNLSDYRMPVLAGNQSIFIWDCWVHTFKSNIDSTWTWI